MENLSRVVRITAKVSYEIRYVTSFNDDRLAECDPEDKVISILRCQTKAQKWHCLIHEILHAIEYEHGFLIPHKIHHQLEEPIYKLLKLNKFI